MGAAWGPNGTIVFSPDVAGGLKSVSDTGGAIQDLTKLNAGTNEISHRFPHFLPDGSGVLFTVLQYSSLSRDWNRAQVGVKSLKTGDRKLLMENATDGEVVGNRYLVFAREGKLLAVRFDPNTLSVQGSPVPVIDGITHSLYNSVINSNTGAAQFSVSNTGTLLYAPGFRRTTAATNIGVDRSQRCCHAIGYQARCILVSSNISGRQKDSAVQQLSA
jgi:hypothetical protein